MSLLLALILLPLLGALAVGLAPKDAAKQIALWANLACCGLFLFIAWGFDWSGARPDDQLTSTALWFEPLGVSFRLGVDTVSLLLIGLTVLLGPICAAASFTAIQTRVKTYYAWLLILQSAMVGVFAARDLVLFYVFFEFTLVPMFILISLYGSENRKYAAVKFFLYTFTGSMLTLAGLAYVAIRGYAENHVWSFDFAAIEQTARAMSPREQMWVFLALMAGFGVKVPIFPVHTWLPLAHTEAPTAGSVVLAGVLLKLGTYGIYRFALQVTPLAAYDLAPALGVLAVLGILVAGLICWVQQDIKKLVAYSSVSHLGFCVLGLFALNSVGLSGSILYMINHGLSTGALFLLIGMIYERYHTRDMKRLGGLASQMPIWATFMVFFTMASIGLPGLNGFISEFMCLLGAFQAGGSEHWFNVQPLEPVTGDFAPEIPTLLPGATPGALGPWFAAFAALGMVVTAMYLLYMLGLIVWGKYRAPDDHHAHGRAHGGTGLPTGHADDHAHALPRDLTFREIAILSPLAIGCIWLGLYPTPLLRSLEAPVNATVAQIMQDVRSQGLAAADPSAPALLEAAAATTDTTGGAH